MAKKGSFCVLLIIIFVFLMTFSSVKENAFPVFEEEKCVNLPVLMYHSVLKDKRRTGKYVITPEKLEEDILYLKKNGYTAISAKQLIRYVYADGTLPKKPVIITFDDGMYNNFKYVVPILKKHNFYAIFSIVGSYTDEYSEKNVANSAFGYLRWCDIKELSQFPNIEFANHSYGFHSISSLRYGVQKNKGEDTLSYINTFYQDTQKLQSEFLSNCSFRPIIYTYPFGSYSKESARVLQKMDFLITLSCTEGINKITKGEDCLYLLKRYNRDGRLTSEQFFKKLKL